MKNIIHYSWYTIHLQMSLKHLLPIVLVLLLSCHRNKQPTVPATTKVEVLRMDSIFFNTPTKDFQRLKASYPLFFPETTTDAQWIEKQNDTLERELFAETAKAIGDFSEQKQQIERICDYVKYYFPHFTPPKVVTLISDVDYPSRVIYADSLLLIGVDNYLGSKHPFYVDLEGYIAEEQELKYLPVDVALSFAQAIIPAPRNATFLDSMLYEGKLLYLAQRFLPDTPQWDLLKYSQEKYQWAEANQAQIWRYFVENQLLYSTDRKVLNRVIDLAPFSKFSLELDSESPGGVGRYIGLTIIEQYMEKQPENIPLRDLLTISNDELFKKANYKPKK